MSTNITRSSSLPRAYIGTHHKRQYINDNPKSSSLLNDYFSSTTSASKSFQPVQSEQRNYLSHTETTNDLQTQHEEQASVKHLSSTTPLNGRPLNLQQEQKAKGFLLSSPSALSSSSSSSLFFLPNTHNVTPLSDYDRSPPSFVKEEQHFYRPSHQYEQHSYWQPLNSENKNNQLLLLEKFEQQLEEEEEQRQQQKQKQSSINSISNHYQNCDLSDIPEENSSFSSSYTLSDTTVENNDKDNQSHLLTSTPILSSFTSYRPTTNNNIFPILSSNKNNNTNKSLPLTSDSGINDQSTSVSIVGLVSDLERKADVLPLNNNMSLSSRYSSNLGTGTISSHPYDQRVSDQGTKYIIQLKTDEYQENDFTITPRYSFNQLIIDAKHREEDSSGGYIHRELHKIFNIPKHIDLNQYTYSYNKTIQELTIEMPYLQTSSITNENKNNLSSIRNTTEPFLYSYKNSTRNTSDNILPTISTRSNYYNDSNNTSSVGTTATDSILMGSSNTPIAPINESSIGNTKPFDFDVFHRSAFRPKIIQETSNNNKKLTMSLDLSDYQAEDIKVSIKDRELIVKAEKKTETDTRKCRSSFFQSTSLPPQTDIEHLQSNYIDGKLIIEAPYIDQNINDQRIKTTSNQGANWETVTESKQKNIIDDPFQQRTETITEYVRIRRH